MKIGQIIVDIDWKAITSVVLDCHFKGVKIQYLGWINEQTKDAWTMYSNVQYRYLE